MDYTPMAGNGKSPVLIGNTSEQLVEFPASHVSLRGGKMLGHSQRRFLGEVMSPYTPGSLQARP